MKTLHTTVIVTAMLFAGLGLFAQSPADIITRTQLLPELAPFYHGVASGDPLTDRVIIWTRLTPDNDTLSYDVNWEIATDPEMTNVVNSGVFTTDADRDFTVKVDATGLQPNNWYYYRFEYDGDYSLVGRTRTAPSGPVDSVRFAVVSCADYSEGYFHAYHQISERNDIDAIIHLGDYIYENGAAGDIGWPHDPPDRISELSDYRQRYSQYRLDNDLRCLHQMYPFINVWDDHEIANNTWMHGSNAHDPANDGPFEIRKRNAVKAFFEWIPIRMPDPSDTFRIYREIQWGDLADLIMIDSRLIGRDTQSVSGAADSSRYMLGKMQLDWLGGELRASTAQWKLIGNQVLMAPVNASFLQSVVDPFLADTWYGYQAERERVFDSILDNNVTDVVVLTGDIHTAWANNLENNNGDNVAVEFVCSSITKQNADLLNQLGNTLGVPAVKGFNPHVKYLDLTSHGYYTLDINHSRAQADFYIVGDIKDSTKYNVQSVGASWYVNDSSRTLAEANNVAERTSAMPDAYCGSYATGVKEELPEATVIGAYPNPFWEDFVLKTYLFKPKTVSVKVFDMEGRMVQEIPATPMGTGLHYIKVDADKLPKGIYIVHVLADDQLFIKKVNKIL